MEISRRKIGQHEVEIEGVMHVRLGGPYLPEEAREFLSLSDEIYRKHGSMFTLADLAQADPPGPETRRILVTWHYLGEYVSVMYGASVTQRAILRLIAGAHRLLGAKTTPRIEICSTEAEARLFIEQYRRRNTATP
jgi:hypothetical protein